MSHSKQPNCHDCVYAEWEATVCESSYVCAFSEEWVGDGSFAEECEEFKYAWDDEEECEP